MTAGTPKPALSAAAFEALYLRLRQVPGWGPAIHEMAGPSGNQADPGGLTFAQDRLGINVHSNVDSHIDALCHAAAAMSSARGTPPRRARDCTRLPGGNLSWLG
jgi:hypothetical protein